MTTGGRGVEPRRNGHRAPSGVSRGTRNGTGHALVHLPVERIRQHAERRALDGLDQCGKCGSTFVVREPAFLHCRYCGKMTRIESGSLLEQELFEVRSGLRLAS